MKKTLLLLAGTAVLSAQGQVTGGLNAHFEFNGNAADNKSGNSAKVYNCTYVADRQGNAGSAIYIKGINSSFVNLGTGSNLKPSTGSVSLWFNPDVVNNLGAGFDYNPVIIAKNDASADEYFEAYCIYMKRADRRGLAITTEKGTNNERYIWSTALSLDNWHHAVVCYSVDSLWFYMDNVLSGQWHRGFTQGFDATDSVLLGKVIGSKNYRNYTGAVDDVRIYNKVLTAAQVDTLYDMPALKTREFPATRFSARVFPNPSTGMVYFDPQIIISSYRITDACGKLIMEGKNAQSVDMTGFKGMYLIEYRDHSDNPYTGKIMIE